VLRKGGGVQSVGGGSSLFLSSWCVSTVYYIGAWLGYFVGTRLGLVILLMRLAVVLRKGGGVQSVGAGSGVFSFSWFVSTMYYVDVRHGSVVGARI